MVTVSGFARGLGVVGLWLGASASADASPPSDARGAAPLPAAFVGPPEPVPRPELPTCPPALDAKAGGRWFTTRIDTSEGGHRSDVAVEFYLPAGFTPGKRYPLVIALHGWNHAPSYYRREGNLAALADQAQAVVVVPDLGRSVYEDALYPKTRRWGPVAGLPFVGRTLLPWCRRELPVRPGRRWTAIVGYSTGGRGAFAVAEAFPEFGFVGSTSGTYDLFVLSPFAGEYRIHAAALGPREPAGTAGGRWAQNDVAVDDHAEALSDTTLYLAHGDADPAVPFDQLSRMAAFLRRHEQPYSGCIGATAGHDFRFWNASMTGMFARWRETLGAQPVETDRTAPTAVVRAAKAVPNEAPRQRDGKPSAPPSEQR